MTDALMPTFVLIGRKSFLSLATYVLLKFSGNVSCKQINPLMTMMMMKYYTGRCTQCA